MKLFSVRVLIEMNIWLSAILASAYAFQLLINQQNVWTTLISAGGMLLWCFLAARARCSLSRYQKEFLEGVKWNNTILRDLTSRNKEIYARDRDIAKLKWIIGHWRMREQLSHVNQTIFCNRAEEKTNGKYFCTRSKGHEGPCASVPFREAIREHASNVN